MVKLEKFFSEAMKSNFSSNEYTLLAQYVKNEINIVFSKIIDEINNFEININKQNLIFKNSPLVGSTAIGFIVESYISKRLKEIKSDIKSSPNVTNSSYDFFYDNPFMDIFINFKVEKDSNNGVCAIKKLLEDYCQNGKPKLYYIFKIKYEYDFKNNTINIIKKTGGFLEQHLDKPIKADKRSWSGISTEINGRLQIKLDEDLIIPNFIDIKNGLINLINDKGTILAKNEIQKIDNKNKPLSKKDMNHLEKYNFIIKQCDSWKEGINKKY